MRNGTWRMCWIMRLPPFFCTGQIGGIGHTVPQRVPDVIRSWLSTVVKCGLLSPPSFISLWRYKAFWGHFWNELLAPYLYSESFWGQLKLIFFNDYYIIHVEHEMLLHLFTVETMQLSLAPQCPGTHREFSNKQRKKAITWTLNIQPCFYSKRIPQMLLET